MSALFPLMPPQESPRRRQLLLKAAGLSAGTLLFTCFSEGVVACNAKGPWYEDGGYSGDAGADSSEASVDAGTDASSQDSAAD